MAKYWFAICLLTFVLKVSGEKCNVEKTEIREKYCTTWTCSCMELVENKKTCAQMKKENEQLNPQNCNSTTKIGCPTEGFCDGGYSCCKWTNYGCMVYETCSRCDKSVGSSACSLENNICYMDVFYVTYNGMNATARKDFTDFATAQEYVNKYQSGSQHQCYTVSNNPNQVSWESSASVLQCSFLLILTLFVLL